MDVEKLIERLHKEAYGSDIEELLLEAATAIETLRAENVKLQYEAERQRRSADDMRHLCENAERAYTKAQADLAAIEDILGDEYDLDRLREHQKDHHATWYDIGASGAHCSRCHYRAPQQSRYCPHCGAKMGRREKP